MRMSSVAMAVASASMLGFFLWASGCSNLSDDCQLNLNCPAVVVEKPNCSKVIFPGDCDACIQTSCCAEMAACLASDDCLEYCTLNVLPSPDQCTSIDGDLRNRFEASTQCIKTKCADKCVLPDKCNPVTHNGCPNDGSSCDIAYPGYFACYSPVGMPAALCQPCNFHVQPYCGSGLRCHPATNRCGKYCCNDSDCGTGRCELNQMLALGTDLPAGNAVGICVNMDPMIPGPSCDEAAMTMSGGSCFAGYPGM
ncbi:MAG: hypothetical protein IPM54_36475 [Polyangiaceae bacterium]|nr:hypothetical protein [Polyangiaceae bacterium]